MGVNPPVEHRAWREARDQVLASVRSGGGLILVLGLPGTGKSLLLRELADMLRNAGYDVLLQLRGDIPIEAAETANGGSEQPRPRVVLIDEADRITGAALERLGHLGARSFVLAGLAGSEGRLDRLPSPATIVRLAPLPPDEIGAFVAARLARTDRLTLTLTEQAASRLAAHSGGMPRVADMLIGAAAFLAAAEGATRVEAWHIDRAAALRDGDDTLPAAPPAQVQAGDAQHRKAGLDVQTSTPSFKRTLTHRQVAILCAAVGIVTLYGWLSLQPSGYVQQSQLAPARPSEMPTELPGPERTAAAGDGRSGVTALVPPVRPTMSPIAPASPAAAIIPQSDGTGLSDAQMLPVGAPAHVIIFYVLGDAGAEVRAVDLVHELRSKGMSVGDPVAVPRRAGRPGVRYFFAEDRETANTVLEQAGLPAGDMVAGGIRPGFLPRPGMIEVTVPPS